MLILLVEDDKMIGEGLQKALRKSGFAVNWVEHVDTAMTALRDTPYDLVILDLGLPDGSGLDVLAKLRESSNAVPVLILTARDSIADKVKGLDAGADDYLLKPFDLAELEARIRSLIRRQTNDNGQSGGWVRYGKISLNPKTHEAAFQNKNSILSGREFSLIHTLARSNNVILSKAQLEEHVYGWNEEVASNAIEVHIHQIRKKLGSDVIRNIRGIGYTLADPS